MEIKKVEVGSLKTNCYILKKDNDILIIDPGAEFEKIKKEIDGKVIAVLITHNHFDHIGALNELKSFYNVESYDKNSLKEGKQKLGSFEFEVIYNPGHTSDSISFYFEKDKVLFSGDFIFKEEIGRCDLPTGDYKEMLKSINKIKKNPNDIVIYPGHGDMTTLEHEKTYNSYF